MDKRASTASPSSPACPSPTSAAASPATTTDEQARWIEAEVAGIRVCGLYLPNGNPAPGPKYDYKLAWMDRLHARAADLIANEETAVILGDYNVIPEPKDCWNPAVWANDALFLPPTRQAFRRLVNLGFTDALRAVDQAPGIYTFWDYQAGAFQKNWGIRIDHVLLTPQAADRLETCGIDAETRSREKPSDHVPIWVTLDALRPRCAQCAVPPPPAAPPRSPWRARRASPPRSCAARRRG